MTNIKTTWIAVAGAHKAYFFEKGAKKKISLFQKITAELDEEHSKPGRAFNNIVTGNTIGSGRHAIDPHTDRREVEKQDFANRVTKNLSDGSKQNKFQKLIVIAEPKMLGLINRSLDKNLTAKMQKSLPKDIAEMRLSEIREYVAAVVGES